MNVHGSRTRFASPSRSRCVTRSHSPANLSSPLAALVMMLLAVPAAAPAQSVSGALAVSATVLPPDRARAPQLIRFSVARSGVARIETAAPIAGAVSQIVMVTISSPTNSFAPVLLAPTLVMATPGRHRLDAASKEGDAMPTPRLSYEVDVGRPPVGSNLPAVPVRITYLIVPGT